MTALTAEHRANFDRLADYLQVNDDDRKEALVLLEQLQDDPYNDTLNIALGRLAAKWNWPWLSPWLA